MTFAEVGYFEPWWMQLAKSVVIFLVVFNLVPVALMADRKVMGRMQNRYGPNRVGPFGAMTPIADIVKLLTKEQFRPRGSNGWLFAFAPVISMMCAAATVAVRAAIPEGSAFLGSNAVAGPAVSVRKLT